MSAEQPKKDKGSKTRDLILRSVVFGGLGILLLFALLDYRAKQSATQTATAWREALASKDEDVDFSKSQFAAIPRSGNPRMTTEDAPSNPYAAKTIETYTWPGIFRKYEVKVYIGLGNDPTIEAITGPGEEAE